MPFAMSPAASAALTDLVRVSRLLGADPALVLHGGGNTSLKATTTDLTGSTVDTLFVKASGHDLASIDAAGFAPLRLARLREILPPVVVPDDLLINELRCALLDAAAPDPSVETLLHALLPRPAVIHSHADALLAVANTPDGRERLADLFGDRVILVDYAMPGPDLVAACAAAWSREGGNHTQGVVVLGHGLFTVGSTPDEAYQHHVDLVTDVAGLLRASSTRGQSQPAAPLPPADPLAVARLRQSLSRAAGHPMVVTSHRDNEVASFVGDDRLLAAAQRGPLTPDHVIWTKHSPMIGTDLDAFVRAEDDYFTRHATRRGRTLLRLDGAPRVVLDRTLGMLTAGRTAGEAARTADIYRHTLGAIELAEALGGYRPVEEEHVFDLEYWSLQQAKLSRKDSHRPLSGQVAVVTGAASGIGHACAVSLLESGASVVGWDVSPSVRDAISSPEWLGLAVDVTDSAAVTEAIQRGVEAFGGVDILVVAAGIFPTSANLGEMSMQAWRRAMAVNVDAVADLYGQIHPFLAAGTPYGRVVLIASKNVAAPGPGAAAYSASKAAVTQLTRVAALEWAPHGIRVNMIHPDAVFDTGLWTPELLEARAEHYGMTVEQYKRRNLLSTEVTSKAVGDLAVTLAGPAFAATTGAQIPIDGGNERVI
ncbi:MULTISPECIES: bifunctional aldolase/short-chain dehydrogenase [unclassified Nocardioides]|uniref:bifunctional aldolase/short-chain dehydrogenase n=1 Tax=unclassified Nocardioides TaxID=2615069 RepID=UPI0000571BAA|nr:MULTISPECIES: bifunctional aldolase/short-chain dehydrogenase [unclassified Nocardioides]ABL79944.1 short-chain dehydrogenase/reductase SDR [Nocardioides sp. JS614]